MPALADPVYRFAGFELEPAERRLSAAGRSIALTPKVFDTLVLLVQRAGHLVSKDELMKALWPRGYVDESNLTKHIWVIRRALGDGEQDPRFIETVPKVGYRFVAQVTVGRAGEGVAVPAIPIPAAPSGTGPGLAGAPAPAGPDETRLRAAQSFVAPVPSRRRIRLAAGLVGLGVLAIAAAAMWRFAALPWTAPPRANAPAAAAPGRRGGTLALVGFSNLSRNAKDAWLAPALIEMLGTEFNAANNLQVVPDELVRDASSDLPPPAAGGYAPQTLVRLRRRLGADYIVSGSYLVIGSADDAPLRVDIALQDARNGSLLASVSNEAGDSQLMALVSRAGAMLRSRLGAPAADGATPDLLASEQPPSLDVARRMGFAADALRHYDAARARDELLEAVAEAPGYAPVYTRLAEAWSALGYRAKALAAAEQATRHATGLLPEDRAYAEAAVETARSDWARATAAWQQLVRMRPGSPEYRLQLIDAQIAAGTVPAAQATWRDLQRLPGADSDPRLELAAVRIATALDDPKSAAEHAENALRLAHQHDTRGLLAEAQTALGSARLHLNQSDAARTSLEDAVASYRLIANPSGEAAARRALALVLVNLKRGHEAREQYQQAMNLYQGIGDVAGIAGVYRDLCSMLWLGGDRDGAHTAARHSLELARETADLHLQAWTLRALATIASDDAASDEVLSQYREVTALTERSGDRGGHVWSLATEADTERLRGELDDARKFCDQAKAEATSLSDPQFTIYSGFICALVDVDRGAESEARAELEGVMRRVGSGGDTTYLNNSLMTLAQLDMDAGRWVGARDRLRQAGQGFAAADEQTGEADAEAMLALCDAALGDNPGRDVAAGRARTLRQSMTSRQEVYVVDIALARLEDAAHKNGNAPQQLLALAADAERRHWLDWSLEAKLAAWELLRTRGATGADALRRQIETTARLHGYGRILRRLQRRT